MTNKCMNTPIVSIVIPMFNVEKYIDNCLQSVFQQSFQHFEVICIDDGCTDNTLNRLKQYTDNRIRIISQKNLGLSGARNTGFGFARGIYIAMLDADDAWYPNKLAEHVCHLNQHQDVDISYSYSAFINDDGNLMGISQKPKTKSINSRDIFLRNPISNGSNAVFRRASLVDVPEPSFAVSKRKDNMRQVFDESLSQSEDIELWLRISLNTHLKFEGINKTLSMYRVNDSGLSANIASQYKHWQSVVKRHTPGHPDFFKRYYHLAKSFQLRYLCRRAIQSGDKCASVKYMMMSIKTAPSIIVIEPVRTIITIMCTLLSLMPTPLYKKLERKVMTSTQHIKKLRY